MNLHAQDLLDWERFLLARCRFAGCDPGIESIKEHSVRLDQGNITVGHLSGLTPTGYPVILEGTDALSMPNVEGERHLIIKVQTTAKATAGHDDPSARKPPRYVLESSKTLPPYSAQDDFLYLGLWSPDHATNRLILGNVPRFRSLNALAHIASVGQFLKQMTDEFSQILPKPTVEDRSPNLDENWLRSVQTVGNSRPRWFEWAGRIVKIAEQLIKVGSATKNLDTKINDLCKNNHMFTTVHLLKSDFHDLNLSSLFSRVAACLRMKASCQLGPLRTVGGFSCLSWDGELAFRCAISDGHLPHGRQLSSQHWSLTRVKDHCYIIQGINAQPIVAIELLALHNDEALPVIKLSVGEGQDISLPPTGTNPEGTGTFFRKSWLEHPPMLNVWTLSGADQINQESLKLYA